MFKSYTNVIPKIIVFGDALDSLPFLFFNYWGVGEGCLNIRDKIKLQGCKEAAVGRPVVSRHL